MNVAFVRRFLLWCTLVNYAMLLVWFIALLFAHDLVLSVHGRWFRLTVDQFDAIHYGAMTIYKVGIMLFNLVPLVVLMVVRDRRE